MKPFNTLFIVFLLCALIPLSAHGSQITVFDGQKKPTTNPWHHQTGEDQEVEPYAVSTQKWDLEGMFFDGSDLSIVGGWDFIHGVDGIHSGDIFISTQGPVTFGGDTVVGDNQSEDILNSFGYNFVFDVDWEHFADAGLNKKIIPYTLWEIDETTIVTTATALDASNPVAFKRHATGKIQTGFITYESHLTDAQTGFKGDPYNIASHFQISGFDLTNILGKDKTFTAHFTQECGNDAIMGQVPEPATLILLGMGLIGIGAIGRKLPL